MIARRWPRARVGLAAVVALGVTGCAFHGLNSLPLPGTVGTGPSANIYHVEIANVGSLESNSPVMIGEVVVGSVGKMTFQNWHADVEIRVNPGTAIPANTVAVVGQTSLLGSMHLELNAPVDQPPAPPLQPGATIALNKSSTYPSTEQTLSSLSAVINTGGLGQIGDIIHNFNAALSGRQDAVRDLITRLDSFVSVLDGQRAAIVGSIQQLNRLTGTLAGQRDVITEALAKLPPALDVLIAEKPRIITALNKLRGFADTAAGVINDTQADLVKNLQNLEPTMRAIADVGPGIDDALVEATVFPYGQNLIDRGLKGDYMNLFAVGDITVPRLKKTLFLGTRWGVEGAQLVPAPGDPGYEWYYTYNPLGVGVQSVPPTGSEFPPPPAPAGPMVLTPSGPVVSSPPIPTMPLGMPLPAVNPLQAEQQPPPAGPATKPAVFPPWDEGGH
jgi:phospholipid/cholesterol/gamma-HCH transport system substrate-binding protein